MSQTSGTILLDCKKRWTGFQANTACTKHLIEPTYPVALWIYTIVLCSQKEPFVCSSVSQLFRRECSFGSCYTESTCQSTRQQFYQVVFSWPPMRIPLIKINPSPFRCLHNMRKLIRQMQYLRISHSCDKRVESVGFNWLPTHRRKVRVSTLTVLASWGR